MFNWILKYFTTTTKDLSQHRSFTVTEKGFRYEDLCQ